jgi:mannose-1-phosphate guanylyltransferase
MKAIMLAAGLGTRLGGVTEQRPKCMIEVGGKAVLRRNLEWAAASGIREVAVNLHHRPKAVVSHFEDFGSPLPIHWSREPELLGTAGTIRSLQEWLGDERFAVIYADNLIDCNLAAVCELHERLEASATVALFAREDVSQSGVAELDQNARILRFIEKPTPGQTESHWVSAGLLALEAHIVASAPETGDIGRDLLPALLAAGHTVAGYCMGSDETLHWIDTPGDLQRTRGAFAEAAR